jgi:hypothetical protein
MKMVPVLSSVANPGPESGAFLTSGSGMGKKQDPDLGSGSGMINSDHIFDSLEETNFLG